MQEQPNAAKKSLVTISVAMLIVGGLIGFGITKAADNSDNNSTKSSMTSAVPTSATKAADLRSTLVMLGVEHMTYTDQAVDAALDGSPNAAATSAALYANGTDLGAAVGSIYGKDAETTFNTVWKLHLDDFVKYAVAGKQGDAAAQAAALADIDANYTKPLAQYLAKANPNLPEGTLEGLLREHVNMTAKMIDLHISGDYSGEAAELKMANAHMEAIFSALASGIVKQYPAKF
ncbi:MAG: hypothetical protein JWN38_529 [Candidatus Saccharibacteria bacterium]|nr:hypothetical protein [Candidatus Saccharibacteria bacterium]